MDAIEICNRALGALGQPGITALVDDPLTATSKAQQWCSLKYPEILDDILTDFPWRWASRRVSLDLDPTTTPEYEYGYAYYLPLDFVRMADLPDNTIPYTIEDGRLLSNAYPFQCRYVFDVASDPDSFPKTFVRALVALLAAELAFPLTGQDDLMTAMVRKGEYLLNKAKAVDATGEQPDDDEDPWVTARR